MSGPDWVPALARTLVPLVVGPLAAKYALDVEQADLVLAMTTILGFLYYLAVRVVEHYFPAAGWLLGVASKPRYDNGRVIEHGEFPPAETDAESVLLVEVDRPTQTDNSPRDEDGPQDYPFPDVEAFTGEMR